MIAEYAFLAPTLAELAAGTLKLIDTIDVFSRKHEQVVAYGIPDPYACSQEDERRYLMLGDVIVAIQSNELIALRQLVPERRVILAGIDIDVVQSAPDASSASMTVTVVASDNPLNVHGLNAFLRECWPEIRAAIPEAVLHVVGRVGAPYEFDDPSIRCSGWVDNLDAIYGEAKVVINPTVAGTGLKIKSVEALAHGKPLVAWTNGVEGLDYEGEPPYRECHSWRDFRDAVISLLRSDAEREDLARRALDYARREFDADRVYAELRTCLESPMSFSLRASRQMAAVDHGERAVG